MALSATDFRGIAEISAPVLGQLRQFLAERELQLAEAILYAWPERIHGVRLTSLRHALELVASHTVSAHPQDRRHSLVQINTALGDYLAVLERSTTELFQRIEQLTLLGWNEQLMKLIEAFANTLDSHLETLDQNIVRLESVMRSGAWQHESNGFLGWLRPPLIEPAYRRSIQATRSFLQSRFTSISTRIQEYFKLNSRARESIEKLSSYPVLRTLDAVSREKYSSLNRFLRIWELDRHLNSLVTQDIAKAVESNLTTESAVKLLRHYYTMLKNVLFNVSREIKNANTPDQFHLSTHQSELSTLEHTVAHYRDFLLRTDPNPYVRSRWGFPEWLVGPEPEFSRQLQRIEFSLVDLDRLYTHLSASLENPKAPHDLLNSHLYQEAQVQLHAMAQPGNSLPLMLLYGERLVKILEQFDELGSRDPHTVQLIGDLLNQALKADWKYCALHEIQSFQRLYSIHESIIEVSNDPQHVMLLKKLKHHIEQIIFWVRNGTAEKHRHSIDAFVNDSRNALEHFLKSINPTNQLERQEQLLEYRYLFGTLFHALARSEEKTQRLRTRFSPIEEIFQ